MVWGLDAPISTFAGQIHQESGWRADVTSPVGASGLAQFMPATAGWISGLHISLQDNEPTNPTWAIRALVEYDKWLYERVPVSANHCEQMAFVLSSYNGGIGNLLKDVSACKRSVRAPLASSSGPSQTIYVRFGERNAKQPITRGYGYFISGRFRVPFPEEVVFGAYPDMLRIVLPMGHDLEVRREKVRAVFVDMVDEYIASQLRIQQAFRYKTVYVRAFSSYIGARVSVVQEDTLVRLEPQFMQDQLSLVVELVNAHDAMVPTNTAGVKCDPTLWFGNVENYNGSRAEWAFKENRGYPDRILRTLERRYRDNGWGITSC